MVAGGSMSRLTQPQEIAGLLDRAWAAIFNSPPEEKLEIFGDACHVLGNLVGGGSISFEEARGLALDLAKRAKLPLDGIEDLAVLGITEGKKHPRTIGKDEGAASGVEH
jgi:hypothetical protein